MSDRLEEIKKLHKDGDQYWHKGFDYVRWLIAEVERLRSENDNFAHENHSLTGDVAVGEKEIESLRSQLEETKTLKELQSDDLKLQIADSERLGDSNTDLTQKLTASKKKLKDAIFDNVDRQVQVGDLLKDKERLQERLGELESSSLKTDCDHPWVIHKDGRDYCSECGEIK